MDPTTHTLTIDALVVVLQVEKNAFRLLAVALPCMLKAVTVHTEIDMPKLTPGTHSTILRPVQ